MQPRLLLCLTFVSVLVDVGHGRPEMRPSIRNPTGQQQQQRRHEYNAGTMSNREQATQTMQASASQQTSVPVFHARSAMDNLPSTLDLASMVKSVMKDTKSAKKVILLPSDVYMLSPEAMLKGKRRYGGASIGGKGMKYGNNGGGGGGHHQGHGGGGYNGDAMGNGENHLEGGGQEGNYEGDEGYDGDDVEYDDNGHDDGEYDVGQVDDGYQDGNNLGDNNEQSGQYNDDDGGTAHGDGGHQQGGGDNNLGNGGGYNAVQQQFGNNGGGGGGSGEVPSNEIGPGIYGRYTPVTGDQLNKKYDTLFREFVLNFFINKYNLKTELPP